MVVWKLNRYSILFVINFKVKLFCGYMATLKYFYLDYILLAIIHTTAIKIYIYFLLWTKAGMHWKIDLQTDWFNFIEKLCFTNLNLFLSTQQ